MKNASELYANRPDIRCAYDRRRVSFETVGPSLTDQSMAQECDINRILAKYQKTGVIDHLNRYEGSYGDFLDVPSDYQAAIDQVMAADEAFAALPSTLRRRFNNSVPEFLLYVSDPANRDEMQSLGMLRDGVDLVERDSGPVEAPQGASKPKGGSTPGPTSEAL